MSNGNGQKTAAPPSGSTSPHVRRLLSLEVGGSFTVGARYRGTVAWYASSLKIGTGRKWKLRRLLSADGKVRRFRVERVA